jgi:hypothetical protein
MSRPTKFKSPKTALALLLLAAGLLIGMVLGHAIHTQPARSVTVQTSVTPSATGTPNVADKMAEAAKRAVSDPPITYLCIQGSTFVVRGTDGIARYPEKDSLCAVKK